MRAQEGLYKLGAMEEDAARAGEPRASSEAFGCAVQLDRKEAEYVELLASGSLQFAGTSPFTLEMWVRPTDSAKVYTLMSKYNRGKWGQYMVRLEPGAPLERVRLHFCGCL